MHVRQNEWLRRQGANVSLAGGGVREQWTQLVTVNKEKEKKKCSSSIIRKIFWSIVIGQWKWRFEGLGEEGEKNKIRTI